MPFSGVRKPFLHLRLPPGMGPFQQILEILTNVHNFTSGNEGCARQRDWKIRLQSAWEFETHTHAYTHTYSFCCPVWNKSTQAHHRSTTPDSLRLSVSAAASLIIGPESKKPLTPKEELPFFKKKKKMKKMEKKTLFSFVWPFHFLSFGHIIPVSGDRICSLFPWLTFPFGRTLFSGFVDA